MDTLKILIPCQIIIEMEALKAAAGTGVYSIIANSGAWAAGVFTAIELHKVHRNRFNSYLFGMADL